MVDPIDEYALQAYPSHEGHRFTDITKEGLTLPPSEQGAAAAEGPERFRFELLCAEVKRLLGGRVEKVVLSERLASSPCVLVTGEYGWSANMERIMRAQACPATHRDAPLHTATYRSVPFTTVNHRFLTLPAAAYRQIPLPIVTCCNISRPTVRAVTVRWCQMPLRTVACRYFHAGPA